MSSMQGKQVVITGGSSGIGLAVAKQLVREGARVVLFARNARDLSEAVQQLGSNARSVTGDVTREADVQRLFQSVEGGLDALFVNAGVAEFAALETADEAHFDRLMNTNVKGAFFTIKHARPLLQAGSSVVFNTSVAADIGAPLCSVYGASKGAVAAFARNLAAELIGSAIRVNVVSPGPTATPIQSKAPVEPAGFERMAPFVMQRMRLGRLGQAEEVAAAVVFLLSPAASFIVGQELAVDGGMTGL